MAILTPSHHRIALVATVLAVVSTPALAQDLSPVSNLFDSIGQALTGALGRSIGLVAIVSVGILFMLGKMNFQFAASIMIGLVIVFGAATILAGF